MYNILEYSCPYNRDREDTVLPLSVHPVLQQLVFACVRASPNDRPSFKVICGLLDILFSQIHLINRDYLEMKKGRNNQNDNDEDKITITIAIRRQRRD